MVCPFLIAYSVEAERRCKDNHINRNIRRFLGRMLKQNTGKHQRVKPFYSSDSQNGIKARDMSSEGHDIKRDRETFTSLIQGISSVNNC